MHLRKYGYEPCKVLDGIWVMLPTTTGPGLKTYESGVVIASICSSLGREDFPLGDLEIRNAQSFKISKVIYLCNLEIRGGREG